LPTGSFPLAIDDSALHSRMGEVGRAVYRRSLDLWGSTQPVCMVGKDPAFQALQHKALKVAPFDEPVLIMGESGVGKESLAQALFLMGNRTRHPFVPVNCPQYREGNLTVSELFGHTKGSFTGAAADRKGCFETADGGVIFLDEVGDLHMSAQVMLLRALSAGEFQPLGSDRKKRVNVRVIAATNRPVESEALGEQFRNDLFFRLRYFLLTVPPLRERGDDWLLLAGHFLELLYQKHGIRKEMSAASLERLGSYWWPGNVRELVSVVTMGYAMAEGDAIEPDDFESLLSLEKGGGTDRVSSLLQAMTVRGALFWDVVYRPFMQRDLNRMEVREIVREGLRRGRGSYRELLPLFNLRDREYQRFMDFLRHHDLKP
jgi:DNA-binding NtrC family response regulator